LRRRENTGEEAEYSDPYWNTDQGDQVRGEVE